MRAKAASHNLQAAQREIADLKRRTAAAEQSPSTAPALSLLTSTLAVQQSAAAPADTAAQQAKPEEARVPHTTPPATPWQEPRPSVTVLLPPPPPAPPAERFHTLRKAKLRDVLDTPDCGTLAPPSRSLARELLDTHLASMQRCDSGVGSAGGSLDVEVCASAAAGLRNPAEAASARAAGMTTNAALGKTSAATAGVSASVRPASAPHRRLRARMQSAQDALALSEGCAMLPAEHSTIVRELSQARPQTARLGVKAGRLAGHVQTASNSQPGSSAPGHTPVELPNASAWLHPLESQVWEAPAMPLPMLRIVLAALRQHHAERCTQLARQGGPGCTLHDSVLRHLRAQSGALRRVPASNARAAALVASVRAHAAFDGDVGSFGRDCSCGMLLI
jgi:hypothetical protein